MNKMYSRPSYVHQAEDIENIECPQSVKSHEHKLRHSNAVEKA